MTPGVQAKVDEKHLFDSGVLIFDHFECFVVEKRLVIELIGLIENVFFLSDIP